MKRKVVILNCVSFFIENIDLETANQISLKYGQLAFLYGDKVKGNPAGDRVLFDDLVELRDKIAVFEKIWSENKTDFRRFLSESL